MSNASQFLVWGNNQSNLLSKSSSKCLSTPIPLSLPFDIISVCASEKHISFLTKDGELYSYGSNLDGRLGVSTRSVDKVSFNEPIKVEINSKIIRVQSGFSHMCALTQKMELYAWGLGDYGALGTGQFKSKSTPSRVDLSRQLIGKIRQISCGAMHTAFLFQDGSVYTCGSNQYGQLGINKPEKISSPIPISFHVPITQISCGVFYTLLLAKDGRVYGMGNNKYGQLGTGHKVNQCHPTLIRELTDIVKVTAGYHSGAIDKFGNLFIWGSGSFGELLRPRKFVLSVPIRDIAIRGFFGIAIGHTSKNQNRIYSWGNNTFGELGLGSYQASKQPQEVETLRGLQVNKIALGVNFALVMLHPPHVDGRIRDRSQQQRQKSQSKYRREADKSPTMGVSDRKSIIGFEEKYLNSHRRGSEDPLTANTKTRDGFPFQGIKSQRNNKEVDRNQKQKSSVVSQLIQQKIQDIHYPVSKSPNKQQFQHQPNFNYRQQFSNKNREVSHEINPFSSGGGQSKDYQKLFLKLSSDYEALLKRYVNLERQIQISKSNQYGGLRLIKQRERQLSQQNLVLKNEISRLSYQMILLNDQVRVLHRKNEQFVIQNQRLKFQQARNSTITLSPIPQIPALSSQIQQEYNRLLTQKQQQITKLTLQYSKNQEQYRLQMIKLSDENASLKNQLNLQIQKNAKIINQHQSLIDQLEIQIKKLEKISIVTKDENQGLKVQVLGLKGKISEMEIQQLKVNQKSESEKNFKQKYETSLRQSVIKGQAMTGRIAQLEVQLNYEKQFNQKYQESITQIKQNNQKLHKELNLQTDINIEKTSKIQNLKGQVQKYKRYKKQLDEKNIQIQQFSDNFEQFKKKSKQIIEQKEKQIRQQSQFLENKTKQFQALLDRKQLEIQDLARENNRVQKELTKSKENYNMLKNQLVVKTDQIQHLGQQKNNMEKKISILSTELKKEVQERESIVKELGQAKREVTRLKINLGQTQSKLGFQTEEKNKALKNCNLKDEEIEKLKQENQSLNQKNDNLKKQNNLYREQNQDLSYQLQTQTKINEQLTKANRQFAESQQQYNQKIQQLESKIYELEDENKSYTPRYQALLIRNRELDDRNRELGEMINKAIQIQAQSYKNNILKQVEINTDHIISQFKEQQEFQFRGRRNKNKSKQFEQQVPSMEDASLTKRGQKSSVIKQEPYTKMMKERITQHKRKVSQSAQKLASLLDMNEKSGKFSKDLGQRHTTQDYQKINSQMESFNHQKQEFMSKIHSFAEKLKII